MKTPTFYSIIAGFIFISFFIGIYLYPLFPARIASHWGTDGQVNGTMGKFWGIFLLPFIMLFMAGLFAWLPKIDPMKENIETFKKYYNGMIFAIITFLFYAYLLTIFWNLGYHFKINVFIMIALAVLFYIFGIALPKTKQNWFVGIRTPWTLSSPRIWEETHGLAGKLFRLSAIFALVGLFFPQYFFWFVFGPLILSVLVSVVYSYFSFRKKEETKDISNFHQ